MIVSSLGNIELLKLHKTAFLCSRKIPASVVLKCYDWAIEQRNMGNCVISGFHSKIEKDVFYYLLAGKQLIIMVLARGMKKRLEPEIKKAIDSADRLLIVTPFESSIKRVSSKTSAKRNQFMIELTDEIVIGHFREDGILSKSLEGYPKSKTVRFI
ncbi:MAG TPA: DNA-binding protein [Lentisphaeria bacterium]|nr:MAG: hypothetical protein A2X47_09315 [Lentisphaerae bacterium GWF2_38_69]HBM15944.1 DNA-binding protein [Lentisphaeria bacterium]